MYTDKKRQQNSLTKIRNGLELPYRPKVNNEIPNGNDRKYWMYKLNGYFVAGFMKESFGRELSLAVLK